MQTVNAERLRAGLRLRESRDDDVDAVQRIYAYHVLNGPASFEEVPPAAAEMAARRRDVLRRDLPYYVAEVEGRVVGYAYAGPYRTRPAYRFTLEDSVYVDNDCIGKGVGRALLGSLLQRCTDLGYRQMVAVIGGAQPGSVALHARHGFKHAGLLTGVGFKFGRWLDSLLMTRPLGAGDLHPPHPPHGRT